MQTDPPAYRIRRGESTRLLLGVLVGATSLAYLACGPSPAREFTTRREILERIADELGELNATVRSDARWRCRTHEGCKVR